MILECGMDEIGACLYFYIFCWIQNIKIGKPSLAYVTFSPISPKLLLTYPHREKDWGIDLAPLFLWLVLLKLLCNQLKIFVNLTFSQKVWPIFLFWFTSCAQLRVLWVLQKRCDIFVLLWQTCQIFKVFYLWLKKFDTKVLRRFRRHGEKFTYAPLIKFLPK